MMENVRESGWRCARDFGSRAARNLKTAREIRDFNQIYGEESF